jgi:hypothetical protein
VTELECDGELDSYASGSLVTGRVIYARQDLGKLLDTDTLALQVEGCV